MEEKKEVEQREICPNPGILVIVDQDKVGQAARKDIGQFLYLHGYCCAIYSIKNPPKPIDLLPVPAIENHPGLIEVLSKLGISVEEICIQKLREDPEKAPVQ